MMKMMMVIRPGYCSERIILLSTQTIRWIRTVKSPVHKPPKKEPPPPSPPSSSKSKEGKPAKPQKLINCTPTPLIAHPSVYTVPDLGNDLNLSSFVDDKNTYFSMFSDYISPQDFNYKLPESGLPEIAFTGRSNVGKSSLIDSLMGYRKVVKISKEPGCTKMINFFGFFRGVPSNFNRNINKSQLERNKHTFYLVDMPGYGFATRSKVMKEQWDKAFQSYLVVRNQSILRRVYILIDSRHGLKDVDIEMMSALSQYYIPFQLVFTKCDAGGEELLVHLEFAFQKIFSLKGNTCLPYIHTVSTHQNYGVDDLKLFMTEVLTQNWVNNMQ